MAKYLGAILGPAATPEINFALPLAKWRGRAKEISASSSSALVSASEYNSRAASVMSYLCQLFDLPEKVNGRSINSLELSTICSIMHVPPQSFTLDSCFDLKCVGGPKIMSLKALATACKVRFSNITCPQWHDDMTMLLRAFEDESPIGPAIASHASATVSPPHWISPAIVLNLKRANEALPPRTRSEVRLCLAEVVKNPVDNLPFSPHLREPHTRMQSRVRDSLLPCPPTPFVLQLGRKRTC